MTVSIMPRLTALVALCLCVHTSLGKKENAWESISTIQDIANIEEDENCWLVDFGEPPSPQFTFAAHKFKSRMGMNFAIWNHSVEEADHGIAKGHGGLWLYARMNKGIEFVTVMSNGLQWRTHCARPCMLTGAVPVTDPPADADGKVGEERLLIDTELKIYTCACLATSSPMLSRLGLTSCVRACGSTLKSVAASLRNLGAAHVQGRWRKADSALALEFGHVEGQGQKNKPKSEL